MPGVRVVAVAPNMPLYVRSGRRGILEPIVFGLGTLLHLLLRGRRYDVVHTASFPYFHLLAAAACARWRATGWWSTGTRSGPAPTGSGTSAAWAAGSAGGCSCCACAIPQRAFCFSRLHLSRLREEGLRARSTVVDGEYAGSLEPRPAGRAGPEVVFAGRHIPEKRVPALVPAFARARERLPEPALQDLRRRPAAAAGAEADRAARARTTWPRRPASWTPRTCRRRSARRSAWCCRRSARATGWWWWSPPRRARRAWWCATATTPPPSWSRRA